MNFQVIQIKFIFYFWPFLPNLIWSNFYYSSAKVWCLQNHHDFFHCKTHHTLSSYVPRIIIFINNLTQISGDQDTGTTKIYIHSFCSTCRSMPVENLNIFKPLQGAYISQFVHFPHPCHFWFAATLSVPKNSTLLITSRSLLHKLACFSNNLL